jgi:hypothetical protein
MGDPHSGQSGRAPRRLLGGYGALAEVEACAVTTGWSGK